MRRDADQPAGETVGEARGELRSAPGLRGQIHGDEDAGVRAHRRG